MKFIDLAITPTREKEENWDVAEEVEAAFGLDEFAAGKFARYFALDIDMKVRLFEDGSTLLLEINGVSVKEKNISV